jgi:integrase
MEYCRLPEYTGPFSRPILDFIEYKRGLGYDYGKPIVYRLREMDLFFAAHRVTGVAVSEEMFDRWVVLRDGESETNRRRRANVLIAFSKFLRSRGYEDVFVGELPVKTCRSKLAPYIFTKPEIAAVFDAAGARADANPKRREYAAFVAMLSLYYGCGLRKTEAQELRMRDVDFGTGCIQVVNSKNHVSRIVVASESVRLLLDWYRIRHCARHNASDCVFWGDKSTRLNNSALYRIYRETLACAGIRARENGKLPRIHDLRHTFCVHTLESMAEKGFDLYVSLPLLVKYLGHKCISETEYYLRLVEENFTSVTEKSKAYAPTLFPKAGDADGE